MEQTLDAPTTSGLTARQAEKHTFENNKLHKRLCRQVGQAIGDFNMIEDGDKVKITLRFRGREMAHQEFGVRLLERVRADIDEIAVVESMPRMEGRQMVMMVAPRKKK